MSSKQLSVIVIALVVIGAGVWYATASKAKTPTPSMSPMRVASTSPSSSTTPMATTQASSAAAQSTNAVTISNYAFSPASVSVKKGTTVTWTNRDSVGHTVTETDGQAGPNSGTLNNDQSYSYTFNTAGTFHYHCSIHHEMVGTVTVTD